jgi:hypothetical protein
MLSASMRFACARRLSRSVAPASIIRIFTAVIGSAVDVAVDIEHSIDEAGADNGTDEEIPPSDIKQDRDPMIHGWVCREDYARSQSEEKQEAGREHSSNAIDPTDIFDHD